MKPFSMTPKFLSLILSMKAQQ